MHIYIYIYCLYIAAGCWASVAPHARLQVARAARAMRVGGGGIEGADNSPSAPPLPNLAPAAPQGSAQAGMSHLQAAKKAGPNWCERGARPHAFGH